jgi:hypothetical protein
MSNPTSNFGWQMPTATDLVTDLPADFEVFGQAVDTSLAELKGGTTAQVLAKTSATDMDFTWTTLPPSGKILQVVHYNSFTLTTTSSTTYATTGIVGSITPSKTTSKVLVMVKIPWQYLSGSSTVGFNTRLYRAGSNISQLDQEAARNAGITSGLNGSSTHLYLDSPSSTSSVTYEIFGAVAGTSANAYWGGQGQPAALVLMEVGA